MQVDDRLVAHLLRQRMNHYERNFKTLGIDPYVASSASCTRG